jgi:hypothetical protein
MERSSVLLMIVGTTPTAGGCVTPRGQLGSPRGTAVPHDVIA